MAGAEKVLKAALHDVPREGGAQSLHVVLSAEYTFVIITARQRIKTPSPDCTGGVSCGHVVVG